MIAGYFLLDGWISSRLILSKSFLLLVACFDLDALAHIRRSWGVFRDRRIDIFDTLLTKDGKTTPSTGKY